MTQERIEQAAEEYFNQRNCPFGMKDLETFHYAAKWALQNQWISVDKELPKKKGFYLIKDDDSVFVNEWDGDEEEPEEMYWVEDAEPTHWMQIPPTEGGEE